MAPVTSAAAPGANRHAGQPARIAAIPTVAASPEAAQSPQIILPVPVEEPRKRPGGLLLSFILLCVIGYSGYRVYPALKDLWQLAREPREAQPIPAKADSLPTGASIDAPNLKTDSPLFNGASQNPLTVPGAPAANAAKAAEKSAPLEISKPLAVPASAMKPPEAAAPAPAASVEKPVSPQTAPAPVVPSPARLLGSRLRAQLTGKPLAAKAPTVTTCAAALITPAGS